MVLACASGKLLLPQPTPTGPILTWMTPGVVPTGEWVHVAVTVDRSSPTGVVFYLNGMPVIQGDATLVPGKIMSGNSVRIGASHRKDGFPSPPSMTGLLDEVQIYHRALFDDEVAALRYADCGGAARCACMFRRSHRSAMGSSFPMRSSPSTMQPIPIACSISRPSAFQATRTATTASRTTGINSGGNVQSDQCAGRPVDRSAAGHRSTGWADRGRRLGLLDGHDRGSRHGHGHVRRKGIVSAVSAICISGSTNGVLPMLVGEPTPVKFTLTNDTANDYYSYWKIAAVESTTGL